MKLDMILQILLPSPKFECQCYERTNRKGQQSVECLHLLIFIDDLQSDWLTEG